MKIETHLHTKEGSVDSIVKISDTIKALKEKGYDGMIVTDHNSYSGYDSRDVTDNFVVFKGVEYDTSDAGHMLIVLPSGSDNKIFTHKGMTLKDTIEIVRGLGGVIGPAHPFDYYKLGMLNNAKWLGNINYMKQFDFIEGFNACGSKSGNYKSAKISQAFNKPMFGGSDSHRLESVGKAHTILPQNVSNETELINLIKSMSYGDTKVGGELFAGTSKEKLGPLYGIGIRAFYGLGKVSSAFTRKLALKEAISLSLLVK